MNWWCKATGKTTVLTLGRVAAADLSCFIGLESVGEKLTAGAAPGPPGTIGEDYHVLTAEGSVRLLEVQAPGTKLMPIADFARGHHLAGGDVLSKIESL